MLLCESYAIITLSVTVLWLIVGRNLSLSILSLAMYFPTIAYLMLTKESWGEVVARCMGSNSLKWPICASSLTGTMVVFAIIGCCILLSVLAGWAKINWRENPRLQTNSSAASLTFGILRAAGEEIGWRVYLLPCLMHHYDPIIAYSISGVVWALFHIPVMILLTQRMQVPEAKQTVFWQATSCFLFAFVIGCFSLKAGSSMWTPTMMHWMMNRINPPTLGSVYTNEPGVIKGKAWKINVEGMAGTLVMIPMAALVCYFAY